MNLYSQSQPKTDDLLLKILSSPSQNVLKQVISDPTTYRCQIIYTQIDRTKSNKPQFKHYYFNYDPQFYFNPASMVKMPLAFLALEKLNDINNKEVNKHTIIQFDSSYERQKPYYKDPTSPTGWPTIAHLIKRAFLISENDPYNRLYQFVGQQEINRRLQAQGYKNSRIIRQFMGFTTEQNRHTNAVRFIKEDGSLIYSQPPAHNPDTFDFSKVIKLGKAHLDRSDKLVNEPFDFTPHNNVSLADLQQMLQSVLFPESVPAKKRFNLSDDDYKFLYQYLSQYPSETPYPKYDATKYFDSYVKFFFLDSTNKMPPHVRVFNKVGWAYGFVTDVSYVADFKNNIEYMLSATVYVNSDEVLNDGKYDYDTIGSPFMNQLGQTIYQYELNRKRKHVPDLSRFRLTYEKRDEKDTRPSIKDADN